MIDVKSYQKFFNIFSLYNYSCQFVFNDIYKIDLKNNYFLLPEINDLPDYHARSLIDIASFFNQFSSEEIYNKYKPENIEQEKLYFELECLRIAIIIGDKFPGSKQNFEKFYESYNTHAKVFFQNNKFYELLNSTYQNIDSEFSDMIKKIRSLVLYNDQYAKFAKQIAEKFSGQLDVNQVEVEQIPEDNEETEQFEPKEIIVPAERLIDKSMQIIDYSKKFDNQNLLDENTLSKESNYKIFTTEFDEIIHAKNLSNSNEMHYLRNVLDHKLKHIKIFDRNLLLKFLDLLEHNYRKAYITGMDEGLVDNKKLANIVQNIKQQNIFKRQIELKDQNTAITILIDNSGSMRGKPITIAAICADLITYVLEKYGIKLEILGFTTKEWRGGNSKKKWKQECDGEKNKGRLNDLRHLIYKSFNNNYRQAKYSIPVMLKEGILKENVDGEALIWAYNRLVNRPEVKKIMLVISDGAPLDEATNSVNDTGLLEKHLKTVIAKIQKVNKVKLVAIGIGHDVTKFYKDAIRIEDSEDLLNTLITKLTLLLRTR